MFRIRTVNRVAVLGICALWLAACGGGSGSSQNSAQSVEDQLGFDDKGIQARQRQVEEHVRDCMKAQGFEYIPVDPAAEQAALLGSPDLSDEEFIAQYGYGISTLYEKRLQQVGDPNAAIRERLTPADLAAYNEALRGQNADATFFSAMDTGDFSLLGGCTKKATDEVFGGAEQLSTIEQKLQELDQRITDDPRMVAALQDWSACMHDAGFSFGPNPDDIDVYFADKVAQLVGDERATTGNAVSSTPGAGGTTAEASYDPAALEAIQKEELAVAKADFDCEEKHISDVEDTVRKEYERAFREQNGDLIQRATP